MQGVCGLKTKKKKIALAENWNRIEDLWNKWKMGWWHMADYQAKDGVSKLMGGGRGNDHSWRKCAGYWNNCFHLAGLLQSQHRRLCPCVIACVCPCVVAHTRTRRSVTGSSSHGVARWITQEINTAKHCRGNRPFPLTRYVNGRYFLASEVWCIFDPRCSECASCKCIHSLITDISLQSR